MNNPSVDCPKCGIPIEWQSFSTSEMTGCPACDTKLHVDIFPAFFGQPSAGTPDSPVLEDESGCYFHPQKKAVLPCSMCGRFICSLCDVGLGGQHVCPSCFEAGYNKRKIAGLESHRILYDDIAVALSTIPLIFFWPTIITAPACIYISLRHWKSPASIIPRTKFRFIIAILISLLQITGWALLISYLASR